MNPSTEDIVNAVKSIGAERVLILPNNKNIIMAAEQAAELLDIEAENATIQEQAQYAGHNGGSDELVLQDKEPTSTVPAKRSFADLADSTSDDSSQSESYLSSPFCT